jgi:hypothetical protein
MQEDTLSMDPRNAAERAVPKGSEWGDPEAIEFVRFCYRRRRVGWPELYDEMCAVAGRGLYRGYDADDLSTIGIGFALYQMPTLAAIVQRVVAEEHERRRLSTVPTLVPAPATEAEPAESHPRLVAVAVGA